MPRGKISGRTSGKLVDTWTYEYQGIHNPDDEHDSQRVKGIKVAIELRLHKKFKESAEPPLETSSVWFTVTCQDPAIKLTGSDIESLRAAMWGQLDDRFKVRWEEYYLVQVSPQGPYEGMGSGLSYSYTRVEKGVAWDGTELMREYRAYKGFEIKPWPGAFTDKQGRVIACIPATEQNTQALERFAEGVTTLRKTLADYLRPEQIVQTLANLSSIPLLGSDPANSHKE